MSRLSPPESMPYSDSNVEKPSAGPGTRRSDLAREAASRPDLLGSVGYLGATNAIAFGAGIIRQKAFAVFLGPAGLGAFSLAASFFELVTSLARLGISTGLLGEFTRSVTRGDWSRAARLFLDLRRIALGVSIALGLGLVLLTLAIEPYLFSGVLPRWTVLVLVLAAPASLVAQLCGAVLNALGRIRTLAISNVTTVLIGLPIAVWLVAAYDLAGAIVQLAAGASVALLVSHGVLYTVFRASAHSPELVPKSEARSAVGAALRVGLAEALYYAVATVNFFVFRSVIVADLGTHANGLYQGSMALSRQYSGTISAGIFVYLYPRLVSLAASPELFSRELHRAAGFTLALVVPTSLALIASRDWIIQIVFTGEFSSMFPLMGYAFSGDVAEVLVAILRVALLASGSARLYLVAGLLAEGLYLGAFLGGLHLFGLPGAAGAYLVVSGISLPLYGIALARRVELRLSLRLVLQCVSAVLVLSVALMSPSGVWTSRVSALALAAMWVGAWRRELLTGLSNRHP